jgi:hypothetical protein
LLDLGWACQLRLIGLWSSQTNAAASSRQRIKMAECLRLLIAEAIFFCLGGNKD